MNHPLHSMPGVSVEGIDLDETLFLTELRVVQALNAPARCELGWRAAAVEHRRSDSESIQPGQRFEIHIEGQPAALFQGQVSAVEKVHEPAGGFMLRLRGYDDLVQLQARQSLHTHVEVTTAELLETLAGDAGLSVHCEAKGPIWPRVIPRFEHDLALLRHYAARGGQYFIFADQTLRLFDDDTDSSPTLPLTLGENLLEARFEKNHVRPVGKVDLFGWDVHTGGEYHVHSGNNESGLQAIRALLGAPVESEGEAEARARAERSRARSNCNTMAGTSEGNVHLRPGSLIAARGVSSACEGPHMLTRVTHSVDAGEGYLCRFDTRIEPPGQAPRAPSLVLGEVSDCEDPEHRGRVQVTLPGYAQAASTWMMVLQPGAGADKGLVALPEPGDLVVVGLPDGDPSRGIVLGGVYRSQGPPNDASDAGDPASQRPYTLTTRAGQRIDLNDADGSITLRNAAGSFVSLTPDGITVHAEGELVIEAPGKQMFLAANSIDLERR